MPAIIISPGTVVDSAGIGAIAPWGAKYFCRRNNSLRR